ncbi:MAG: glutamate formimidoyltransferase [Thermoplasmata archaeon]|nr:glutamate formimidoyltransferase [Thermoplasmata archaeon]
MSRFECVPNFSEGKDAARIERIVAPARLVPGVTVLDVESNADHNRCVISLAGEGDPLVDAVFAMIRESIREIDLNHHRGEHPRMGAADVVPFVPLGDSTLADAAKLAERLAERVWRELQLPVYLYAAAARRSERQDLGVVRQGGFEGIRDTIATDPARTPDFGDPRVHPTAGIVAIGARPVLIAYNAYLATADVAVAKTIARAVRARDGGLAEVKALGFEIRERQRAQVSMNLTDYRRTPIHRALEAVRREAARYGTTIEESEIVGLVPEDALLDAAEFYLQLNRFDRSAILERRLTRGEAVPSSPAPISSSLAPLPFPVLLERFAARTPTPGGGSAAAAAGAIATSLGSMVVAYASPADRPNAELGPIARELLAARTRFLELLDLDAAAYEAVRTARRGRREHPGDVEAQRRWETAMRGAAEVPLETARLAVRVIGQLEANVAWMNPNLGSDLTTAISLLRAARDGALANVAINLDDLRAAGLPIGDTTAEIERLRAEPKARTL